VNGTARRNLFLPMMGGLVALAWLTLVAWERSPYGRYLEHGDWTGSGFAASLCRVLPGGSILLPALLYVAGWLLMSAAMMLPTALPLLDIFRRLTAGRSDRRVLMALVVAGYLVVWTLFGIAVHLADAALHAEIAGSSWLAFNGWMVGALVIAGAGAFQFTSLKYYCLDRCRAPLSFVIEHWRGYAARRHAVLLGLRHGLFCVGCCWAIMLLMFVVGTGNVGWMLALGAVMAVEKNAPWGRRLSAPLGAGLLAWSAAILALHLSGALA
jgi:predicted metal-binding membrane protein